MIPEHIELYASKNVWERSDCKNMQERYGSENMQERYGSENMQERYGGENVQERYGGENTQGLQKLVYLHLFTDYFMKISLQSSE